MANASVQPTREIQLHYFENSALGFERHQRLGQKYVGRCWNQARLICWQRFLSARSSLPPLACGD
jgi:hypothetical protein